MDDDSSPPTTPPIQHRRFNDMHTMKFDNFSSEKTKQKRNTRKMRTSKNLFTPGTVAATTSVVENYGPILTKELSEWLNQSVIVCMRNLR